MKLGDFPSPLREALALHETFRTLGFASDQIFVHRNPAPMLDLVVILRHNGRQLATTLGAIHDDNWRERWTELANAYNNGSISDEVFHAWYLQSFAGTHHVQVLLMLHEKGIEPPYRKD